jgi:hypothetical protein
MIMRDLARLPVGKIVTADGRTYEAFTAVAVRPPARVLAPP